MTTTRFLERRQTRLLLGVWSAAGGAAVAVAAMLLISPNSIGLAQPHPTVTVTRDPDIGHCADPQVRKSFNDGPCVYYPKEGPPPGLIEALPTCGHDGAGDPVARCVWPGDANGDGQPDQ